MAKQAICKEVSHVPRPPPRSTNRKEALAVKQPTIEQPIVLPLDQLWMQLPADRRQEVLQRFTQMMVQRLAPPDNPREAGHE